jgi:hypothetical protein
MLSLDQFKKTTIVACLFAAAIYLHTLRQLDFLAMMPGDLVDARLNNYFLENIYQYATGNSRSLVQLPFFYPYPFVGGFSDNLFGSAPVYVLARHLTGQPDTAFQIWYLFGYLANYLAAYYAFRRLDIDCLAAATGALIFAFALPVTAHSAHAQLHYRFAVPIGGVMLYLFLVKKEYWHLVAAIGWLVWQFYCSVYIGFFMALLFASMILMHALSISRSAVGLIGIKHNLIKYVSAWQDKNYFAKRNIIIIFLGFVGAIVLLFYSYLEVTMIYGFKRSWEEISSMLPTPQSYLLTFVSHLWPAPPLKIFLDLPMRWEHQMFMGAIPIGLAIAGYTLGRKGHQKDRAILFSGSLIILILLTINVRGFSLWMPFSALPLASSIRGMTRIDLVMLFHVAFLAAVALAKMDELLGRRVIVVYMIIIPLLFLEFTSVGMNVSSKQIWRERLSERLKAIPTATGSESILFFSQAAERFQIDELDAMWAALVKGMPTLNGYSGWYPPNHQWQYHDDCGEYPRRILSYLDFVGKQGNLEAYGNIASRVVTVGFRGCNASWRKFPPSFTTIDKVYSADELRKISLQYLSRRSLGGVDYVDLTISNAGEYPISARDRKGRGVHLSWRYLDKDNRPLSGWDARAVLPFDIPAHGSLMISIKIDDPHDLKANAIQFSFLQETVYWAHDIGVVPLRIDWVRP